MNSYKIALIGAGNVAQQLGTQLFSLGFEISWLWNRNASKGSHLAQLIGAQYIEDINTVDPANTLVIFAINDDAIVDVAAKRSWDMAYLVHTSGSFNTELLAPFATQFGAIYPLQTLRQGVEVVWENIPIYLEYNTPELGDIITGITQLLSEKVAYKNSVERSKIHLSGVFVNNFLYFLLRSIKTYCKHNELDFETLFPLFEQTTLLAFNSEFDMQTGPAKRSDLVTINKHSEMLKEWPEMQSLYIQFSQSILNTYHESSKIKL